MNVGCDLIDIWNISLLLLLAGEISIYWQFDLKIGIIDFVLFLKDIKRYYREGFKFRLNWDWWFYS